MTSTSSNPLVAIKDYLLRKAVLEKELPELRRAFETYIVDKSIPLKIRWNAFQDAPDEFKDHTDWMIDDNNVGFEYIRENWFDAPEIYGRGKRINLAEKIDDRCSFNADGMVDAEDGFQAYRGQTPAQLAESAMEEVLRLNLGSFCWDW